MTSSWMLVAGAFFAAMGAFAKLLGNQFTGAELSMYRSLVTLVTIGVVVLWRRQSVATPFGRGHFWRGFMGTISLVGYFYTMTQLPLATAIMLNYTSPLWLTLLTTILLRERFKPLLLVAILSGLVGVALLLRPTFTDNNMHAGIIGLVSGFFAACAYVNVKKLGEAREPEWRVVFYFGLAGLIGSAVVQLVWQQSFHPVTVTSLWPLLGIGIAATLAQLAMTRAYHSGKTLVVAAFAYSTVVFAAIVGWVFFDERLPVIAWIGMAIVVASGLMAKLVSEHERERKSGGASDKSVNIAPLPAEED